VSAAFRLKQAGVAVKLSEREDRLGGRTRTEHLDKVTCRGPGGRETIERCDVCVIATRACDVWAAAMRSLSDAEVFGRGIVKIERVLPGISRLVEGYHVQRWDFTATKSFPGYYKQLAEVTRRLNPGGRVQLAGDHFALACVNTAVTSGELAAGRIIARFLNNRQRASKR